MEPIEEIRKRWIDNDGNLTNAGDDINCHDLYIMADMRFLLAEVDRQAARIAELEAQPSAPLWVMDGNGTRLVVEPLSPSAVAATRSWCETIPELLRQTDALPVDHEADDDAAQRRIAELEAEVAALKSEAQNPYVLRIPDDAPRFWAKECEHLRTYRTEATVCRRCARAIDRPL